VFRTAVILSSITLFVAWYVHVVNRTSNGADFRRERLLKDVAYSATVAGALYVLLVTWALVGVYAWHVRSRPVGILSVLGPPLVLWTAFSLAAFAIGVALAEVYCLADMRAFRRETRRRLTRAVRDEAERAQPPYERARWWPASRERLMSDDPAESLAPDHTSGVTTPVSLMSRDDSRGLTAQQ
jgi:hypothetical protein